MSCEECKKCINYLVSELGCFGDDEPCKFYVNDEEECAPKYEKKLNIQFRKIN